MQAKPLNLIPLHVTLLAMSATALIALIAKSSGLVLNVTGSMPGIVYQLGHGEKGSLVSFCSPIARPSIGHGACPDGSLPLIKRVVGFAGDRVTASDVGIEINGQPVPNSRPLDLDAKGTCPSPSAWIISPQTREKFGWLVNTRTALIPGISDL
jgi:type IV secretory pathway protease TraF